MEDSASDSSEHRTCSDGRSTPLHRRSQMLTFPSRLHVARTLLLDAGWNWIRFTEEEWFCKQWMGRCVVMSIIKDVWSPEAVASSRSSDENSRSIIEFICGRKPRYALENPRSSSLEESNKRIPPSSSPTATNEFAIGGQHPAQCIEKNVLQLTVAGSIAKRKCQLSLISITGT